MISKLTQPLFGSATTPCNTPAEISAIMITAFSGALIGGQWNNKTVRVFATLCAVNSLIVIVAIASFKQQNTQQQQGIDKIKETFSDLRGLAIELTKAIEVIKKENQQKPLNDLADAFQEFKQHCANYTKEAAEILKNLKKEESSS